ncbi:uncharacterized protein B0I36DRAFT_350627 [Microdochium trichocladiopsis]|uniref:Enoyl reductase (ER) domain-containing protein n=1 Tax=Microdochium trichocladiopsis TaxID=1682393 RepID=A0A9P8Y3G5_9PEZI|nr:uncharacterized protein B0I36DRAFT_350627 [Microdochium trichocladiopsis]KAH7029819.1 hypothetical protein B0I36DRAFT_350627 [Microdochium trichocladiopsis]
MSNDTLDTFHGWLGHSAAAADGQMQWGPFTPRAFQDDDVDIAVTHCAVCHTDHGMLTGVWGPVEYPLCVGHEIVGRIVRVGPKAKDRFAIGDRVGFGAQCDACLNRPFPYWNTAASAAPAAGDGHQGGCVPCSTGQEQYCPEIVPTYGVRRNYDGTLARGGYATHFRAKSHFTFPLPPELPSAHAAPMLCGGITTYSPLVRFGCGPGKAVGVVGLGGLGHFAVLWAKALGADRILGFSRSVGKKDDAMALGCDEYLATLEDGYADAIKEREASLDIILCTASSVGEELESYITLLKPGGTFVLLGNADGGKLQVPTLPMLMKKINVAGSLIGSPAEIRDMFKLAVEKGVKPWVQERDMQDANEALKDIAAGNARYRLCLVNKDA